jgi:hypothetical protein
MRKSLICLVASLFMRKFALPRIAWILHFLCGLQVHFKEPAGVQGGAKKGGKPPPRLMLTPNPAHAFLLSNTSSSSYF